MSQPSAADPGSSGPACDTGAAVSDGYGSFLVFADWYRGVGAAAITCTEAVPKTAIVISVQLEPSGGDVDAKKCDGPDCSVSADAK